VRASLVTRDLRVASSARQSFALDEAEFDPAEVWYKSKKVIAACLDTGRTLAREISGVVVVTGRAERVEWYTDENEVVARGRVQRDPSPDDAAGASAPKYHGTLAAWLVWNLTGVYAPHTGRVFGKTRARAPFDAELPVVAVFETAGTEETVSGRGTTGADTDLIESARRAWLVVDIEKMDLKN
jgi:hypothetical protein